MGDTKRIYEKLYALSLFYAEKPAALSLKMSKQRKPDISAGKSCRIILQRKKPQQNKSRCALTHITTKTGKRSSIKSEDLKT